MSTVPLPEKEPADHGENRQEKGQSVMQDVAEKRRSLHFGMFGHGFDHEVLIGIYFLDAARFRNRT